MPKPMAFDFARPVVDPAQVPPAARVHDERDRILARVAERAERASEGFHAAAKACIVAYLADQGPTAGEVLTEACKRAGLVPPDDRAFGPVFMSLARQGRIVKAGFVPRQKGHGTAGGHVWRLAR